MARSNQTVLRFVVKPTGHPLEVMNRFHPQGKTVLNSTAWRGKEPRTCGVTKVRSRPHTPDSNESVVFDVEVSYRPRGCITFVGNTKYDGWTAMVLDRAKDGTFLDGHGKPLSEGQPPVYLPYELYDVVDFNQIDFGEFRGEFEVEAVKHVQFDDVMRQIEQSSRFSASIKSTFVAPRRDRPLVKIVLSSAPSGTGRDGFGTRIINVNNATPHLQQVLLDHLTELVSGFIEGRYSMKCLSDGELVFVEFSDLLVDCAPNEQGKESRFNCLGEYVPADFFDELANRLMATYELEVTVVDGEEAGLLLRRPVSE
ncbi:hypothetical protein LCGC14_1787030 [marine sediment metagenome]|uniref:Uncharacterized protein n=1 Tax=marine sediment metagenome TaxID=412755 RepID=A0A0F9GTR2_9ZZZZ